VLSKSLSPATDIVMAPITGRADCNEGIGTGIDDSRFGRSMANIFFYFSTPPNLVNILVGVLLFLDVLVVVCQCGKGIGINDARFAGCSIETLIGVSASPGVVVVVRRCGKGTGKDDTRFAGSPVDILIGLSPSPGIVVWKCGAGTGIDGTRFADPSVDNDLFLHPPAKVRIDRTPLLEGAKGRVEVIIL